MKENTTGIRVAHSIITEKNDRIKALETALARLEAFATGVVLSLTNGERCHDLLVVIESIADDEEGER